MRTNKVLCIMLAMLQVQLALSEANGEACDVNVVASCSDSPGLQKLRLSLEWFMNPDHLPLLVANRTGIFETEGLQVEIIEPDEHFAPLDKIRSGELDVAITEPIHLVQDRAKGEEVLGFARFLHTDGGVMFNRQSGIARPRDLCRLKADGKKIRLTYPGAPGVLGPAIVKTMAEADGGVCTTDSLDVMDEGFYHTKALQDGKADVATLIFYNFEMVEAKHSGLNASYFSLKHWGVPDFCQLIYITTPEHFKRRASAMRMLTMATRKAVDWIKIHPREAKQIYNDWTGQDTADKMNDDILDATLPMFPNDQSMPWEYYENLEKWLASTGQLDKLVGTHDYWTNVLAL